MKDNVYKVYKHTSPSGKVYIGITKQSVQRRWQHGKHYDNNDYFYRAIQKYGWDNFNHDILYTNLTQEEASKKEQELIKFYKSTNPNFGYNISIGGEFGSLGHKLSEETKKKLSEINKGKKLSDETKRKIGEHSKTISHIEDGKKKSKKVKCIETGTIYYGIREASRQTKINNGSICQCTKGKLKTAGGYHWEYVEVV